MALAAYSDVQLDSVREASVRIGIRIVFMGCVYGVD